MFSGYYLDLGATWETMRIKLKAPYSPPKPPLTQKFVMNVYGL